MQKITRTLLSVALLAGFASFNGASAQAQTTIRIANLDIGPFVPVAYVAKLAKKYNIDVKITNFRRGLETAQALKAGEFDIAVGGIEAAISAIGSGAQAIIVSSVSTGGVAWVGQPDENLKTVKDLKGKKFAVIRGLHELVMRVEFEQAGLTSSTEPGKDVQIVFINSPPATLTALKSKSVDAISAPEPFPSRAIGDKYAKPMLRPYDTPLGNMPRAIFMSKSFHDNHRTEAQGFMNALVEAVKTFRDDPKLAKDFALNDALKGAMSAEDWDLGAQNLGFDVSLTVPTVQAYVDYMHKYDMLKTKFDAATITDFTLLENAKKKVGW